MQIGRSLNVDERDIVWKQVLLDHVRIGVGLGGVGLGGVDTLAVFVNHLVINGDGPTRNNVANEASTTSTDIAPSLALYPVVASCDMGYIILFVMSHVRDGSVTRKGVMDVIFRSTRVYLPEPSTVSLIAFMAK